MPDLTLKRVDAAILKSLHIKSGNLIPAELGATTIRCQFSDIRTLYFAAMQAAAKLKHRVRAEKTPSDYEYGEGWDAGHDAHQSAIRATAVRLKKEAKANG